MTAVNNSTDLLNVARLVQRNYASKLLAAIDREQALLRTAIANHSSMPDNYWQDRFRLTRQVEAINAIIEVLEVGEVRGG